MYPANRHQARKIGHNRWLHAIVFIAAMLSFGLNSANARAASPGPTDYRVAVAVSKFDDTWQIAVVFKMRPPRRLRANHPEPAIGSISTSSGYSALFVELSFSQFDTNFVFHFTNR